MFLALEYLWKTTLLMWRLHAISKEGAVPLLIEIKSGWLRLFPIAFDEEGKLNGSIEYLVWK